MKKVLVTGYTGFIGRSVIVELTKRDYEIVGLYHNNMLPEQANMQQVHLDLLDRQQVDDFFVENKFDSLIHLAWYLGPKCHVADVNLCWLTASLYLLEKFRKSGGKKFLCNGTISEYDFSYGYLQEEKTPLENPSLHGRCKSSLFKIASEYCLLHGIEFRWPRVFNLYGPDEKHSRLMPSVINSMLRGESVKVSECLNFQDYLHVFDTAHAIVDLFESAVQGAVNVCSGSPVQLRTIVEIIAQLTHFKGEILWGSIASSLEHSVLIGSNAKLVCEVGWKQKISLVKGLQLTINWWKNNNV